MVTTACDPELVSAIHNVEDPELPHVTIGDLGMVRSIDCDPETGEASIVICPTYTGCPATEQIVDDVVTAARRLGFDAKVHIALAPAWSTEWITARGHERLRAAGIAPPHTVAGGDVEVHLPIPCPRCGSRRTERVAEFGSTACKASYRCGACAEPFDYFKPF